MSTTLTAKETTLLRYLAPHGRAVQDYPALNGTVRVYDWLVATRGFGYPTLTGSHVRRLTSHCKALHNLAGMGIVHRVDTNEDSWHGYISRLVGDDYLPEEARLVVVQARLGGV